MNYKVYYLPFPETIRGAVHLCKNGDYIIGINEKLSRDEAAKTLRHELHHIRKNHFFDPRQLDAIEAEADG